MFRGFESHRLRQKQRPSLRWPLFLAFGDGGIHSRVKKTSQCGVFSGMGRIPPRLTRKQLGAVLSIPAVGLLETVEIRTGSVVNEAPAEPQSRAHGPPRTAGRIPPCFALKYLEAVERHRQDSARPIRSSSTYPWKKACHGKRGILYCIYGTYRVMGGCPNEKDSLDRAGLSFRPFAL